MQIMVKYLVGIGIKANLTVNGKVQTLIVKGMDNIFIPVFNKIFTFFYLEKKDSFDLLVWVKRLIYAGGHHTYLGLNALINKIYSSIN